jgi:hypothetical protein
LRLSKVLAKLRPALAAVHLTQESMDSTPAVLCIQLIFSTKANGRGSRLENIAIGVSLTGETEKERQKAERYWITHLQRCGLCYRDVSSRPRVCAEEMAEHRILKSLRTDSKKRTLDWITIAYVPGARDYELDTPTGSMPFLPTQDGTNFSGEFKDEGNRSKQLQCANLGIVWLVDI